MLRSILQIQEDLPLKVRELLEKTFKQANLELQLQVTDASVFLWAIIQLGDTNSSARWLHSTGLTDETILVFIKQDFNTRSQYDYLQKSSGVGQPFANNSVCTPSTIKMFTYLDTLRFLPRAANGLYVASIVEAIAYAESDTVKRIFASVGLSMADVRHILKIPSIIDLQMRYPQHN